MESIFRYLDDFGAKIMWRRFGYFTGLFLFIPGHLEDIYPELGFPVLKAAAMTACIPISGRVTRQRVLLSIWGLFRNNPQISRLKMTASWFMEIRGER
jgi:hypothetical protein